jgi:hypothetical protein
LRFRLDDMGSGDHFRQPPPRVLPVGLLRPVSARGDQQFASAGDRLPAMSFSR